jgi:hypothetical protein
MIEEEAADQYVVDQLRAAGVHAGESLLLVHERGDVPEAGRVALVGAFEAGGLDLGTRRALEDLGRGGGDLVVEVAEDGHVPLPALAVEELVGERTQCRGLGGPPVEGVRAITGPLALVPRLEPSARICQQLRLQVAHRHRQGHRPHGDLHRQQTAARTIHRLTVVVTLHGPQWCGEGVRVSPYS